MKLTLRHFFNFAFLLEVFLFAFAQLTAIGIALKLAEKAMAESETSSLAVGFGPLQFIIMFLLATAVLLLILRYFKKPWLIKGLFYLAIFQGLLIFTQAYFGWPDFLYVLGFLLFVWFIFRNVIAHNLVIVLAVAAIAVIFGLNLTPFAAVIILLFLAVYDYWAVYKTKHMVKMFSGMAKANVHFSLIIPFNFKGLLQKTKNVSPLTEFMFLGTGDVVLPAILVIASLKINIFTSLMVALGAILGLIVLHIIFILQKERAPMPGLPPIVLGSLLGFLAGLLLI